MADPIREQCMMEHFRDSIKAEENKESTKDDERGELKINEEKEEEDESLIFKDKFVLVTGGSSGIGAETAIRFSQLGATLGIVGRNINRLIEVARKCKNIPLCLEADITKDSELQCVFLTFMEKYKRIDILVNSAGILKMGSILQTSMKQYDSVMNINLRAAFHLIHMFTPELIKSQGCIINVSSVSGLRSAPNILPYSMSKAALDQLTRAVALELGPHGVRCNAVNPGVTETLFHIHGGMNTLRYKEFLEINKDSHALGRSGNVAEVANAILFLASNDSSFITGASLPVDGGLKIKCPKSIELKLTKPISS